MKIQKFYILSMILYIFKMFWMILVFQVRISDQMLNDQWNLENNKACKEKGNYLD